MMPVDLVEQIRALAQDNRFPDGKACRSIGVTQVRDLSERMGIPGADIEIAALKNEIIPQRYARNFNAFSFQDQIRLLNSTVAVIGLGGLGGGVVEILARIGVGSLILVDGDKFEDSNLNRQLFSTLDGIGKPKAQGASLRVGQVNPSVRTAVHPVFVNEQNIEELIGPAHVVVDCLDNIKTRFLVQGAARRLAIPMVTAAIAGNIGQLMTIFPGDLGLCLIHGEPESAAEKGAEKTLGCLPQGVCALSSLECSEVVKILLNKTNVLRNRLLLMDLNDNSFEIMQLAG